jgi:protein-S-isoprenylcysteine O-methyltransferase Ste14
MHPALERSVYTWLASLLLLVVCVLWRFVPGAGYRIPAPWSWLGYGAQLCGIVLAIKGSKVLDVLDLAGLRPLSIPLSPGTTQHVPLMTTGVYGLVRHPIYLGWALFLFGMPQMTPTRLVFAIISTLYLAIAIPWEERGLINEFGARYEEYRRQVRWRMVPRIY